MTGQLELLIRYALYPLAGALTALGFVTYDDVAQTLTISLHDLSLTLAGAVVYAATVIWCARRRAVRPERGSSCS